MLSQAAELARRLARDAEGVCRHYLSNGRRLGNYWLVGDVANKPGRSLYVRLKGPECGKGAAGKWTDAATGEHGDLLDLIAIHCGLVQLCDVLDEASRYLGLPRPEPTPSELATPAGSPRAARRLFAMSSHLGGTIAEAYLRNRGITAALDFRTLRFHPHCFYGPGGRPGERGWAWPALIAAVTDCNGRITGVQRTWLHPSGCGKAPVSSPRRALGQLLGNAVRFGRIFDIMAAGEGIETMLSLRSVLPNLPVVAALSANHLAAFVPPPTLRRLYVARDDDPAGHRAADALLRRAEASGIEALPLVPRLGDFNDDLRALGAPVLVRTLCLQLTPTDLRRSLAPARPAVAVD
jgi:hypothetical protein